MSTRAPRKRADVSARTLYLICGLLLAIAVPPWFVVAAVVHFSPNVELRWREAMQRPADANWQFVKSLGDRVWREPVPSTFAGLNGGRWTALCVNGGLTDPVATFAERFGDEGIPDEVRERYDLITPVGDYDLAVTYADETGHVESHYVVAGGSLQSFKWTECMGRGGGEVATP